MIRLTDSGFIRESDSDFSDGGVNGTKFKCYRFGKNVRVTYGRAPKCDMVFITADVHDNRMKNWDYDHKSWRSHLAGHDLGWKYNGIYESEFNLKEFIRKCEKLDEYLSNPDEYLYAQIDISRRHEMEEAQTKLVEEFLWRSNDWGRKLLLKKMKEE